MNFINSFKPLDSLDVELRKIFLEKIQSEKIFVALQKLQETEKTESDVFRFLHSAFDDSLSSNREDTEIVGGLIFQCDKDSVLKTDQFIQEKEKAILKNQSEIDGQLKQNKSTLERVGGVNIEKLSISDLPGLKSWLPKDIFQKIEKFVLKKTWFLKSLKKRIVDGLGLYEKGLNRNQQKLEKERVLLEEEINKLKQNRSEIHRKFFRENVLQIGKNPRVDSFQGFAEFDRNIISGIGLVLEKMYALNWIQPCFRKLLDFSEESVKETLRRIQRLQGLVKSANDKIKKISKSEKQAGKVDVGKLNPNEFEDHERQISSLQFQIQTEKETIKGIGEDIEKELGALVKLAIKHFLANEAKDLAVKIDSEIEKLSQELIPTGLSTEFMMVILEELKGELKKSIANGLKKIIFRSISDASYNLELKKAYEKKGGKTITFFQSFSGNQTNNHWDVANKYDLRWFLEEATTAVGIKFKIYPRDFSSDDSWKSREEIKLNTGSGSPFQETFYHTSLDKKDELFWINIQEDKGILERLIKKYLSVSYEQSGDYSCSCGVCGWRYSIGIQVV